MRRRLERRLQLVGGPEPHRARGSNVDLGASARIPPAPRAAPAYAPGAESRVAEPALVPDRPADRVEDRVHQLGGGLPGNSHGLRRHSFDEIGLCHPFAPPTLPMYVGRRSRRTYVACRRARRRSDRAGAPSLVCPAGRHHTAPVRLWSLVLLLVAAWEATPPWWAHTAKPREIAPAVIFVAQAGPDQTSAASADGSAEKPFSTVGEALRAAPAGALVRIAEGTYPEALVIDRPAVLAGAGAAKTRLVARPGQTGPVVRIQGDARVELRDLAVEHAAVGVAVDGGAVRLQRVALRELAESALVARDAEVAFFDGEVLAIGAGGRSVAVQIEGGSLEMRGTVLRRSGRRAIEIRRARGLLDAVEVSDVQLAAGATPPWRSPKPRAPSGWWRTASSSPVPWACTSPTPRWSPPTTASPGRRSIARATWGTGSTRWTPTCCSSATRCAGTRGAASPQRAPGCCCCSTARPRAPTTTASRGTAAPACRSRSVRRPRSWGTASAATSRTTWTRSAAAGAAWTCAQGTRFSDRPSSAAAATDTHPGAPRPEKRSAADDGGGWRVDGCPAVRKNARPPVAGARRAC